MKILPSFYLEQLFIIIYNIGYHNIVAIKYTKYNIHVFNVFLCFLTRYIHSTSIVGSYVITTLYIRFELDYLILFDFSQFISYLILQ